MPNAGLIAFVPLIAAPATNSGLIVLLPVVAAFVGAIIGAWANSWYRNREAKKAEDRELKGLMALILSEVTINEGLLAGALDGPVERSVAFASSFETSVWDHAQARLTQLLPERDEVPNIAWYYAHLRVMRIDLKLESQSGSHDLSATTKESINNQRSQGLVVAKIGYKYVDDPSFFKPMS